MNKSIAELIKDGPVLTDGSWGSLMMKLGLEQGECPDSWNLTHPDRVEGIARGYVEAGSRIILTNTFGSNRFVLGKYGLADKVKELNAKGVGISRKAAGNRALVFASIGPSGKMLITRDVTEGELYEAFGEQAKELASAGADAIVVETMMDVAEAVIAARAAKETGLPVIACLVFDAGKNRDRTMIGNTPEQAVEELMKVSVDGIGANCGQGIEGFIPICKRMRAATNLPLWMKPNAGLPEIIDNQAVYKTTPGDFASFVPALLEAGAIFIGGCCGTNPEFIKKIGEAIKGRRQETGEKA